MGGELPIWSAVSKMAATPEPLSLIPGPARTLSRWPPTTTTSSVSPVLVWAITLCVFTLSMLESIRTVASPGWLFNWLPTDLLTLSTGILLSSPADMPPLKLFSSALLAMMTAAAPASAAAWAFSMR